LRRQYIAERRLDREGSDIDLGPLQVDPHADDPPVAVKSAHPNGISRLQMHDSLHPILKIGLLALVQCFGRFGLSVSSIRIEPGRLGGVAGLFGLPLGGDRVLQRGMEHAM